MRAARLEEENARLRRELEEAKRPKERRKIEPVTITFAVLAGAFAIVVVVITLVVSLRDPVTRPRTTAVPKALDSSPALTVLTPAPPKPRDWAQEPQITDADLWGFAQSLNPPVGYAVGSRGTILRHYARAGEWTNEASGTTEDLHAVATWLKLACAVGAHGAATCLLDPEDPKWQPEKTGTTSDLLAVAPVARGLVAVGRGGTIVRRDFERHWSTERSGTKEDLFGALGDWVVGAKGTILLHELDGWVAVPSGTREDLFAVALQGHDVLVVGAHGTILRRGDPRAGFRPEASGTTRDLFGASNGGAGYDFWAVGAGGVVVHSAMEGSPWTPAASGTDRDLKHVKGSIPTMYIVGDRGTLLSRRY
jgi:hypothetical protein